MISAGLRFGRYEVGDRLGTGGFGMVYRARDVELGRELAIKFLKPEYLERQQVVQRFLQEARAAAQISHPGIVTVFECGLVSGTSGSADGNAFIAMELLRGESLTDRMKKAGKLPTALAVSIGHQLAEALAVAHQAGIIHRDLKPDNVYLLRDPAVRAGERIKILDFGVAKLAEPADPGVHTHSQMMLGTPRYMSPEQARSAGRIDHRSDIYSLGCILFEMLAGRPPYTGDMHDTLLAHQSAPVPSVRAIAGATAPQLDRLIASMMAKAPDDRPSSMAAVSDTLGALESTPREVLAEVAGAESTTLDEATLVQSRAASGRRRIRLAALVAGGLALGGTISYLALRGGGAREAAPKTTTAATPETTTAATPDAALVAKPVDPPDTAPTVLPPEPLPLPPPPDAPDTAADVRKQCLEVLTAEKWQDVLDCAIRYAALDGAVAAEAAELRARATTELAAQPRILELEQALANHDLRRARAALAQVTGSVYHARSQARVNQAEVESVAELVRLARAAARRGCRDYNTLLKQELDARGKRVVDEVRRTVPCRAEAEPAAPRCDLITLMREGTDAYAGGQYGAALERFDRAFACEASAPAALRAFMAACKLGNRARARYFFQRAPSEARKAMTICVAQGITEVDLEAP